LLLLYLNYLLNFFNFANKKGRQRARLPAKRLLAGSATRPCDVGGLGTFRSLHNFKFHRVSFLQGAITIADNGGIMDKNVGAIIAPDEAVSF